MDSTIAYEQDVKDWKEITPPPVPQPKGRDIFLELYRKQVEEQAPQPTFDTTTPEYMKRAAKYNAIARGLQQLASTASLAMGGSVNKPEPDTKTPAYIQGHLQYLDKYKDMVDRYNLMNYNNKLRSTEMMYQDAARQEAIDRENQRDDKNLKYRTGRDKQAQDNWEAEQENKNKNQKIQDGFEERRVNAYEDNYRSLINDRNNPHAGSSGRTSSDKTIKIRVSDGKVYEFAPEEAAYYRDMAFKNVDLLQKIAPHLFEGTNTYDPISKTFKQTLRKTATDEDIIRAWVEYQLQEQKKSNKNKNGGEAYYGKEYSPETTTPKTPIEQPTPTPTPTAQNKTIDYSKLTY